MGEGSHGESNSTLRVFIRKIMCHKVMKSLEFQEPFYRHCMQCEVHKPPEAHSPIQDVTPLKGIRYDRT